MQTAVSARNTVHVVERSTTVTAGVERRVGTFREDDSITPRLAHAVGTIRTTQLNTRPPKTTTQREQITIVKKTLAIKTGKKAWDCTTTSQVTQVVSMLAASTTIQSVDNLGPETVDAIPVWHVRVVASVAVGGQSIPLRTDYDISQADFTLVRSTTSDSATLSGVTATSTSVQDFTGYGEPVHVTLPAACRGTSRSAAGDLPSPVRSASDDPTALAGRLAAAAFAVTRPGRPGMSPLATR